MIRGMCCARPSPTDLASEASLDRLRAFPATLGGTGYGFSVLRDWLPQGNAPMMKQDEYRKYARDAVRLASHASSTAKKTLLLALAERWLDLADAEGKRAKADQGSHFIHWHGRRQVSGEHQGGE